MYALVFRANGGFCAMASDDPNIGTFETFTEALDVGGAMAQAFHLVQEGEEKDFLLMALAVAEGRGSRRRARLIQQVIDAL